MANDRPRMTDHCIHDLVMVETRLTLPATGPVRVESVHRCETWGCRHRLEERTTKARLHEAEAILRAALDRHGMVQDSDADASDGSVFQGDLTDLAAADSTSIVSGAVVVRSDCRPDCVHVIGGTGTRTIHGSFCPNAPDLRQY